MLRKQEKQYQVNIERKRGGVMGGVFNGGMKRPQVNKKHTISFPFTLSDKHVFLIYACCATFQRAQAYRNCANQVTNTSKLSLATR